MTKAMASLAVLSAFAGQVRAPVPVTALAFSPDSKLLVSAGYKQVLVWNPAGQVIRRIPNLPETIRALAFNKDGSTLAVAGGVPGRSGIVTLVDFASGAATTLQQAADVIPAIAFSPDGKLLATGAAEVAIWSIADRKIVATLKTHTDAISGLAFSRDGKFLASGSADKTVKVWDTANWTERVQLPQNVTDAVNGVAFSPEGDLLAFAVGGNDERAIRIWRTQNAAIVPDPAKPYLLNQMLQTRPFDTGTCLALAVTFVKASPSRMLAACNDNTVRMLGANGNTIATMAGHTDWVYAVAASADGQRIASGGPDGTVRIWSAAGKLTATLTEGAK